MDTTLDMLPVERTVRTLTAGVEPPSMLFLGKVLLSEVTLELRTSPLKRECGFKRMTSFDKEVRELAEKLKDERRRRAKRRTTEAQTPRRFNTRLRHMDR